MTIATDSSETPVTPRLGLGVRFALNVWKRELSRCHRAEYRARGAEPMPDRQSIDTGLADLSGRELDRLYGTWTPHTPRDVAELFTHYSGVWWIAGGWAIEAFTGKHRDHHDIDPSVLRAQLPLLRRYLAGRFDLWSAAKGALRPLLSDDRLEAPADEVLLPECGQLWLRESAATAWDYDLLLSPGSPEEWIYRRDPSLRLPLSSALWERDGVLYLQPEIQLLYKAKARRAQDDADFNATLPLLNTLRRAWLRDALVKTCPSSEHPWIDALR